jgi:hypothetical protein
MRGSEYLSKPELAQVLKSARRVRKQARLRLGTITKALAVSRSTVCHWETRGTARNRLLVMRYVRVIQGLQRHLEIGEERDEWDWDWRHAGYRQPGSIAGRRDERAGALGQGRRPG